MITSIARMDAPSLILLMLGIVAGISILIFLLTFFQSNKRSARIDTVLNRRRGELAKSQLDSLTKTAGLRQARKGKFQDLAMKMYTSLNLQNILTTKDIRNFLATAGVRGRSVVAVYFATRFIVLLLGVGGAILMVGLWEKFPYAPPVKFIFYGIGGIIGFYLPKILIINKAQKRQQEMSEAFPDTMDLLVICVEAGLSVEAAFSRVVEEIMDASPILAQELGLATAELAYLGDRRKAYENFAQRTGLPAAKSLATTLIQTEQYGTPVGSALKVLSEEKRRDRMNAAEKKAAALPAKLTVPMIIFFLPLLFMVVIGPAIIQVMALD